MLSYGTVSSTQAREYSPSSTRPCPSRETTTHTSRVKLRDLVPDEHGEVALRRPEVRVADWIVQPDATGADVIMPWKNDTDAMANWHVISVTHVPKSNPCWPAAFHGVTITWDSVPLVAGPSAWTPIALAQLELVLPLWSASQIADNKGLARALDPPVSFAGQGDFDRLLPIEVGPPDALDLLA
eukprot:185250-Prymnesium_polylepis.2